MNRAWLLAAHLASAATGPDPAPAPLAPPAHTATTGGPPAGAEPTEDGPLAITTRLSPDPSHIGDLLTLEVIVGYPAGYTVSLPAGLDLSPLYVVDTEEGAAEPTGSGLRKVFTIHLQAFDLGERTVPSFPLTYVGEDGAVQTATVPPRRFTVEALTANEVDPERRGEDPMVSPDYPNETAETAIWAALATVLLLLVAAWVVRRLRRRSRGAAAPPPVPPHEEALSRLADLEAQDLPGRGEFQAYYLALTEIARAYLERRFGIPALDRTTEEIRRALVRAGGKIAPIDPDAFVRFLQRADLVKFARMETELEEARRAMAYVRELVEATAPKETPNGEPRREAGPPNDDRERKEAGP